MIKHTCENTDKCVVSMMCVVFRVSLYTVHIHKVLSIETNSLKIPCNESLDKVMYSTTVCTVDKRLSTCLLCWLGCLCEASCVDNTPQV